MSLEDSELNPSELGTKEYWDKVYSQEIENFKDHGEEGENWFGEESIHRISRWLNSSDSVSKSDTILDIGCGNGKLLIELSKKGFTSLTGIDYSEDAIELAKQLCLKHNQKNITFKVENILSQSLENQEILIPANYKIILDKGTYDAICLSTRENKKCYKQNIYDMLISGGLFIITSCNWTEEELIKHFESSFIKKAIIATRQFSFGGKKGNTTTTLIFQKL